MLTRFNQRFKEGTTRSTTRSYPWILFFSGSERTLTVPNEILTLFLKDFFGKIQFQIC
jgi:hypothetical protein